MSKTRVIGYIRSAAGSADAFPLQLRAISEFVAARALDLVRVEADPDASGATLERPGLQAALAAVREGRAEAVIVSDLARLTRSATDLATVIGEVAVLAVDGDVDTRDPRVREAFIEAPKVVRGLR